ncbi:hypothetical protein ACFWY5_24030 [Nonomuraea sp. NPDC059007]|uniref:hypothetical protein n=1 Tax=Nonomuraea sp. NPDC059007 TaxID=3346692 RepID=UPI00369B529E
MTVGTHTPPGPDDAATPAEFALAMLRLKAWSGLSYRQLEKRAAAAGDSLPRTSIASALDQGRLPAEHLLAAFVRACGAGDTLADWLAVRRAIAAASVEAPDPDHTAARRVIERRALVTAMFLALVVGWLILRAGGDIDPNVPSPTLTRAATPAPNPVSVLDPPTDAQLRNPPDPASGAAAVLYVGDSIATETAAALTYFIHATGKGAVTTVTTKNAQPCDILKDLPRLLKQARPRLVVLQFWTSSKDCATRVAEVIAGSAVPPKVVWVLQGPDRDDPGRAQRLNEQIYQQVADRTGGVTADAGRQVSWAVHPFEQKPNGRYEWLAWMICNDEERRHDLCTNPKLMGGLAKFHPDYDPISLCLETTATGACLGRSPGVIRYSRAIAETVVKELTRTS